MKIPPFLSSKKISSWFLVFLISWYVSLCVANLFAQRPLWNDEYWVFQSVKNFDLRQMFGQTLVQDQTFPRVYLFLIQQISQPFGFHLLGLRFLSFVCMISAFFLWIKIALRELREPAQYLTFLLSWCASVPLIYYSAELKQYSMDVLAAVLWLTFILHQAQAQKEWPGRRYRVILACLPALFLFSYPSYFFAVFPFYNLLRDWKEDKGVRTCVGVYVGALAFWGVLSYFFDIRLRPSQTNTETYADYFIYFSSAGEFFKTLGEGVNNLFSRWFAEMPRVIRKVGWGFVGFGLIYLFYGFFKNFKRERYRFRCLSTVALVVFLEAALLGALKKYPFGVPRTSLFFAPVVLFLTVKGIAATERINVWLSRGVHVLYVVFLIIVALGISRVFYSGHPSFAPVLW